VVGRVLGFTVPATVAEVGAIALKAPVVTSGRALSNAPMSQAGPRGRSISRWSMGSQNGSLAGTASIAGLPAPSAMVWVAPPLPARAARSGSECSDAGQLFTSGKEMLGLPPSVNPAPPHWLAEFVAMIELRRTTLLPSLWKPPTVPGTPSPPGAAPLPPGPPPPTKLLAIVT
jgi:hypothetical protein